MDGGILSQTDETATPALAIRPGTETTTELTFDARRVSGDDGFTVLLSYYRDDLAAWWAIGGFKNTKSTLGFSVPDKGVSYYPQSEKKFQLETGRWYSIHLQRQGSHVLGTINGGLMLEFDIPQEVGSNGKLGLGTWSTHMEFRNISFSTNK